MFFFFFCIQISSIRVRVVPARVGLFIDADAVIGLTKDYVSVVDGASTTRQFGKQNKVNWNG